MSSLLQSFTGGLGLSNSYNKGQAQAQLGDFTDEVHSATGAYGQQLAAQKAQNAALAGTNYQQNAQDIYGQQQNAASLLYNQATGKAASAADLQMQQGLANANNQAQSAMLSQQGGVSPGLSQRNMLNAQAMQNASIVGGGMVNRAAEQAQAQQAYSSALGNMQGQQQNLGQFQYQQGQQGLNNANLLANQQLNQDMAGANAVYGARTAQAAAQNEAAQKQAQLFNNTLSSAAGMMSGMGAAKK